MRKSQYNEQHIRSMQVRMDRFRRFHQEVRSNLELKTSHCLKEIEKSRIVGKTFVHIDMDMFFCAVEIRDNPSLADQPVAVGGPSMICTTNYIARRHGVRAAMPGFIGKRLCPDLIFVKPNNAKYRTVSQTIRKVRHLLWPHLSYELHFLVFVRYDSSMLCSSLDEASLDITEYLKNHGLHSAEEKFTLVSEIRKAVFDISGGLLCSAGIAPSRLVAKICSEDQKPNGQTQVDSHGVADYMKSLSVRRLPGIGKCRDHLLEELGIRQCGHILTHAALIQQLFPPLTSQFLFRVALGLDRDQTEAPRKSVSCERTFSPMDSFQKMATLLFDIAANVTKELHTLQLTSGHLTVKVKFADFEVKTFATKLKEQTSLASRIYQICLSSLHRHFGYSKRHITSIFSRKIRLLGIRCAALLPFQSLAVRATLSLPETTALASTSLSNTVSLRTTKCEGVASSRLLSSKSASTSSSTPKQIYPTVKGMLPALASTFVSNGVGEHLLTNVSSTSLDGLYSHEEEKGVPILSNEMLEPPEHFLPFSNVALACRNLSFPLPPISCEKSDVASPFHTCVTSSTLESCSKLSQPLSKTSAPLYPKFEGHCVENAEKVVVPYCFLEDLDVDMPSKRPRVDVSFEFF
ncbi:putative Dna polymerase kappa [Cardiosporidium cionae]|uniref:DNA polymerase kappa n=1 Tax=Cardiosporidium cionae TaxID=476202 RepID=A0ABQ7JAT6_9APIC|nr:putative Dna polymerase kappa [Cardiosporidium cionae]|eukprot:KAF8821111.1 putative Dna polymerase kappa [Cardiosporidium cionae]